MGKRLLLHQTELTALMFHGKSEKNCWNNSNGVATFPVAIFLTPLYKLIHKSTKITSFHSKFCVFENLLKDISMKPKMARGRKVLKDIRILKDISLKDIRLPCIGCIKVWKGYLFTQRFYLRQSHSIFSIFDLISKWRPF